MLCRIPTKNLENFYFKTKRNNFFTIFSQSYKSKNLKKFLVQILIKLTWDIFYPTDPQGVKNHLPFCEIFGSDCCMPSVKQFSIWCGESLSWLLFEDTFVNYKCTNLKIALLLFYFIF